MSATRYEVRGSTAVITLDNPEKRNAITDELIAGITDGMSAAESDTSVRAVLLTHTGNTFCAGADLTGTVSGGGTDDLIERLRSSGEKAAAVNRLLVDSPRPVIAAVRGHVRAGGMGLVASCDFVVAGPQATFGLSEVRLGVIAAIISPPVLSRVNDRVAADWLLRGRAVSADEAAASGLITRAVDDDTVTLDGAVSEILADLRKAAPTALAASKRLVNRAVRERMDAEMDDLIALSAAGFASAEGQAGIESFKQRTTPPWVLNH